MDSAQARPRRSRWPLTGIPAQAPSGHGHEPSRPLSPLRPCPRFAPAPRRGGPGNCEGGGGGWWGMGRPALFLNNPPLLKCFSCWWTWVTGSLPFSLMTPKERGGRVRSASLSLEACPEARPRIDSEPPRPQAALQIHFPLFWSPCPHPHLWGASGAPTPAPHVAPIIQPFLNFLPFLHLWLIPSFICLFVNSETLLRACCIKLLVLVSVDAR